MRRLSSMVRVKLRQFSIKRAKKGTDQNHNIVLNGIRTRYCLFGSPEHYQRQFSIKRAKKGTDQKP